MVEPAANKPVIRLSQLLLLVGLLIGIHYFLPQVSHFNQTLLAVKDASIPWLMVGLFFTGLSFLASAYTQMSAAHRRQNFREMVNLQLAGGFLNHFLPISLGGINLIARYFQKQGSSRSEAITYSSLPIIFGVITTVAILLIVSPLTLINLIPHIHIRQNVRVLVSLVVAGVLLGVIVLPIYGRRMREFLHQSISKLVQVSNHKRMLELTLGSIAITLAGSLVLFAAVKSVHLYISIADAFILYVTSSLISNVTPTPGGLGATEAALALGLAALGIALPIAIAITLIFRFLTFWLPLAPGAYALRRLRKLGAV